MFIGHLPAGYLLTKGLQARFRTARYLALGLVAGVLPDADIPYFYLVDRGRHLHHGYWIHIPFWWLVAAAVAFAAAALSRKRAYLAVASIFFGNVFLHLLLDTVVGKIEWLYPYSDRGVSFFEVPATHGWWVCNFVFHWTFLIELAIASVAAVALVRAAPRLDRSAETL